MADWLFRRVSFSIIASCAILGALMWGQAHQPVADDKPVSVGSPAWHMDRCEPAAVGEYPSRVILFPKGQGFVKSTSNPRLLHESLEQALAGKDFGHQIVGFCK